VGHTVPGVHGEVIAAGQHRAFRTTRILEEAPMSPARLAANPSRWLALVTATALSFGASPASASVPAYDSMASMNDVSGASPWSRLTPGADGALYGTAPAGGPAGMGMVYRVSLDGQLGVVHAFAGGAADGAVPAGPLLPAPDGGFYGTTSRGGAENLGTIFEVYPDGRLVVLHAFSRAVAHGVYQPAGRLVADRRGALYGILEGALHPKGPGAVYKFDPVAGTFIVLHRFLDGADGADPQGGLTIGADGALYGTTVSGRDQVDGGVFRLSTGGAYQVIHTFDGASEGCHPFGALAAGPDGWLYGTTPECGPGGGGTLYRVSTAGMLEVVRSFTLDDGFGIGPQGAPSFDAAGTLYMGTEGGGAALTGTLLQRTTDGTWSIIHDFAYLSATDGAVPRDAPIPLADGTMWGTTFFGGAQNAGTVYRLRPGP
jgi:uncharacterized repeat protein (TIGR03803 family)